MKRTLPDTQSHYYLKAWPERNIMGLLHSLKYLLEKLKYVLSILSWPVTYNIEGGILELQEFSCPVIKQHADTPSLLYLEGT